MARKIVWSKRAANDFARIIDYWDNHNKSTAYSNRLIELVAEDINLLVNFPVIGSKTDYANTYQHLFDNFKIYYRFSDNEIVIVRIWDTRRNPTDLKL